MVIEADPVADDTAGMLQALEAMAVHSDIQAETTEIVSLDERTGERVAKLFHHSRSGYEGSAIAKRHVEALAKKHNTTVEKLKEAAAAAYLPLHAQLLR